MTFLVYLEPSRSAATWKWLKNLRHDLLYLLVRNYPTPAPSAGRYTVWLTCHLDWLSHMREVMGRFYQRQCVGWPSPKVMAVITGTSVPICCNLRIRLFYASLQNTVAHWRASQQYLSFQFTDASFTLKDPFETNWDKLIIEAEGFFIWWR
jgi:hypothetical protein